MQLSQAFTTSFVPWLLLWTASGRLWGKECSESFEVTVIELSVCCWRRNVWASVEESVIDSLCSRHANPQDLCSFVDRLICYFLVFLCIFWIFPTVGFTKLAVFDKPLIDFYIFTCMITSLRLILTGNSVWMITLALHSELHGSSFVHELM